MTKCNTTPLSQYNKDSGHDGDVSRNRAKESPRGSKYDHMSIYAMGGTVLGCFGWPEYETIFEGRSI